MPLDELVRAPRNPKRHASRDIAASLSRFGYIEPIVLDDRTGRLVVGHGRLDELTALEASGGEPPEGVEVTKTGWLVPVMRGAAFKDDTEAEAYLLAANQIGPLGGWDTPALMEMLQAQAAGPGLEGIGFSADDLELMIAELNRERTVVDLTQPTDVAAVTRKGDVWELGEHRLMCGDCRNPRDVDRLLNGAVINVAVTSPPYADRRKYDESTEFRPVPPEEYVEWFEPVQANIAAHMADDGSWFLNLKAGAEGLDVELYAMDLVLAHARRWGWHFAFEFCWERTGVPGRFSRRFKNQFEPVYQFTRGEWKFRPEHVRHYSENAIIPLGPEVAGNTDWRLAQGQGGNMFERNNAKRKRLKHGYVGNTSEVQGLNHPQLGDTIGGGWALPGNRLPTFTSTHEALGHPAAFPVGLPAFFVRAYTDRGDVVYDPFAGSGSTLIAAAQEGRVGFAMEVSPAYCDLAKARWEMLSGEKAKRVKRQAHARVGGKPA